MKTRCEGCQPRLLAASAAFWGAQLQQRLLPSAATAAAFCPQDPCWPSPPPLGRCLYHGCCHKATASTTPPPNTHTPYCACSQCCGCCRSSRIPHPSSAPPPPGQRWGCAAAQGANRREVVHRERGPHAALHGMQTAALRQLASLPLPARAPAARHWPHARLPPAAAARPAASARRAVFQTTSAPPPLTGSVHPAGGRTPRGTAPLGDLTAGSSPVRLTSWRMIARQLMSRVPSPPGLAGSDSSSSSSSSSLEPSYSSEPLPPPPPLRSKEGRPRRSLPGDSGCGPHSRYALPRGDAGIGEWPGARKGGACVSQCRVHVLAIRIAHSRYALCAAGGGSRQLAAAAAWQCAAHPRCRRC